MIKPAFLYGIAACAGLVVTIATAQEGVPERRYSLLQVLEQALNNPAIQLQEQQVLLNQGVLRVASGQFDTTYTSNVSQSRLNSPLTKQDQASYAQLGVITSNQASNGTDFDLTGNKLFRNGISIGPTLQLTRSTDNLASRLGLNESRALYQMTVPLLRGRGREVVAAQEKSAAETVESSRFDLSNTTAQVLASAAVSYWNVVAAQKNLDVLRQSEDRGKNYVNDIQTLIAADRVAKVELNQVVANLAQRTAARIAAEGQWRDAQQKLAIAMGLLAPDVVMFPLAGDELPDWTATAPNVTSVLAGEFIQAALRNRGDVLAADRRLRAAEALLPAAKNQLRPQLNLSGGAGYGGLLEGTGFERIVGSPFQNVKGVDLVAKLSYSFAPKNNVAYGALAQAEASRQQAVLQHSDVSRNVASSVITAMNDVATGIDQLRKARESVASYKLALDGEKEKFRLGIGNLVDVLTVEDRLTNAQQTEIQAQLNFATALGLLRFATGTIVDPAANVNSIDRQIFTTLPLKWASRP